MQRLSRKDPLIWLHRLQTIWWLIKSKFCETKRPSDCELMGHTEIPTSEKCLTCGALNDSI